jgi:hypothetical protein
MPFKEPLRILILPEGISIPPPAGNGALVLNPGPPPEIDFYTGDVNETLPAHIVSRTAPFSGLEIEGPDFSGLVTSQFMYVDQINGFPGYQVVADLIEFLATGSVSLLTLDDTLAAGRTGDFFGGVLTAHQGTNKGSGFLSDSTAMLDKFDVDGTDVNAQTNTAYAAPATSVGFAFVAPPSGRGLVTWRGRMDFNFAAAAGTQIGRSVWVAPQLRNGSIVGAGTDPTLLEGFTSPNDDIAAGVGEFATGTVVIAMPPVNGIAHVSGLTAGNDYNLQLRWRCNSATTFNFDILYQMIGWTPLY